MLQLLEGLCETNRFDIIAALGNCGIVDFTWFLSSLWQQKILRQTNKDGYMKAPVGQVVLGPEAPEESKEESDLISFEGGEGNIHVRMFAASYL